MTDTTTPKLGKVKERGNGRGTIYALKEGRYRWQVRNELGKVLASGTSKDKTTADRELAAATTKRHTGQMGNAGRITFAEYAKKWLSRQQIRETTRRMYKTEIAYVLPHIGKKQLKDIRPSHIKDMLSDLSAKIMQGGRRRGKPMSTRTLGMIRQRVRSICAEAITDQLIFVNPCDAVKRVKSKSDPEPERGIALDFVETQLLRELGEALHDAGLLRLWPAIFLTLSFGTRRGETMALRWCDIDFETNTIRIRQNLVNIENIPTMGKPKTAQSIRDIPMPKSLREVLLNHKRAQAEERTALGVGWNAEGPVFATIEGTYTHPDNLRRSLHGLTVWTRISQAERERRYRGVPISQRDKLKAILDNAKPLPAIAPHSLRHTAATLLLRNKIPVELVSKILGHSTISTTLNVYRHVLDSELRAEEIDLFPDPVPVRVLTRSVPN